MFVLIKNKNEIDVGIVLILTSKVKISETKNNNEYLKSTEIHKIRLTQKIWSLTCG